MPGKIKIAAGVVAALLLAAFMIYYLADGAQHTMLDQVVFLILILCIFAVFRSIPMIQARRGPWRPNWRKLSYAPICFALALIWVVVGVHEFSDTNVGAAFLVIPLILLSCAGGIFFGLGFFNPYDRDKND